MDYGYAHFNRDASPGVLNLNAYQINWRANIPSQGLSPARHRLRGAGVLDLDFRLEDGDRLTDDPDAVDGAILEFELHVHAPGPVQLMALHSAE